MGGVLCVVEGEGEGEGMRDDQMTFPRQAGGFPSFSLYNQIKSTYVYHDCQRYVPKTRIGAFQRKISKNIAREAFSYNVFLFRFQYRRRNQS